MKTKTKEEEIAAIKSLIEMDGYFAECFRGDFEKMAENIRKDFPIEMGTHLDTHSELIKKHNKEIEDLCGGLLCLYEKLGDIRIYECVVSQLGRKGAITLKRALRLKITDSEIDFLIEAAKQK
ncbi:MAG: hypothetical protein LBG17_00225 [Bacteroidales bacterium]|jgi:hypothetical protein|nr:hypothetical protein [Bacteroidales bacterium]